MADRGDFTLGWISGWCAATNAITQSLQQALQGTGRAREMRMTQAALAETAGDKPGAPRRRGRPPKPAGGTPGRAPRKRRGRPRKKAS